MATIDCFSDTFRKRQKETLHRAKISGCTKKEIAANIYGTDKRTFLYWLKRLLPDLVTNEKYKTYTPAEVNRIIDKLGDPTKHNTPMHEYLK